MSTNGQFSFPGEICFIIICYLPYNEEQWKQQWFDYLPSKCSCKRWQLPDLEPVPGTVEKFTKLMQTIPMDGKYHMQWYYRWFDAEFNFDVKCRHCGIAIAWASIYAISIFDNMPVLTVRLTLECPYDSNLSIARLGKSFFVEIGSSLSHETSANQYIQFKGDWEKVLREIHAYRFMEFEYSHICGLELPKYIRRGMVESIPGWCKKTMAPPVPSNGDTP